ncbi:4-alpha-glucanotransferase, partial [Streptococcus pyogenes]
DSIELPHNHRNNVAAYTGTHDNHTIKGWYEEEMVTKEARAFLDDYSNRRPDETINHTMLRMLFSSVAFMAIATMQDLLDLDASARMNL